MQNSLDLIDKCENKVRTQFDELEHIALGNQKRVLEAFQEHRVTEEHFGERTGYGIDDPAREVLDRIFASVFETEAAAVRMQLVSGTHALACVLFGNLKSGDKLVCVTGRPYDTLEKVIGQRVTDAHSLVANGVEYAEVDALAKGTLDESALSILNSAVAAPAKMVYIQKSCGYSFERRTLTNTEIEKLCRHIKNINPTCSIMVDNCYGEFVESREPTAIGADVVAGSLIKNPGGGLAITGGYIAGKTALVEGALNRLTAPGIGGHLGIMFNQNRLILQGLFFAPNMVLNALKSALLTAAVFSELGYEVKPGIGEVRGDIIQAIKFGEPNALVAFLKSIQQHSPVNSHVVPEPAEMPGYEDKVVMAGGTFVEGSTIEFSADGPLRPPYVAFVQGGLSYLHVKCALSGALESLPDRV